MSNDSDQCAHIWESVHMPPQDEWRECTLCGQTADA